MKTFKFVENFNILKSFENLEILWKFGIFLKFFEIFEIFRKIFDF